MATPGKKMSQEQKTDIIYPGALYFLQVPHLTNKSEKVEYMPV